MKSSFGNRLFYHFLLFAVVPAVILTLVGYYIASQEDFLSGSAPVYGSAQLAEYYHNKFADQIAAELTTQTDDADARPHRLDFVFRLTPETTTAVYADSFLTDSLTALLVMTSRNKSGGFVEMRGRYVQFGTLAQPDGSALLGGIIHDPEYTAMLRSLQSEYGRLSSNQTLRARYFYFLGLLFLVITIVTAGLAYWFSRRLSRNLSAPLSELSLTSRKIAQGDFEQRVRSTGIGEVQILIDNFNLMAQQLKTTTTRLAQTERVAAWRHVARRFAHELKNPLQPILVSLFRIEKNLQDTPQYDRVKESLEAASEELKHLTELAERFSQLAKLPPPDIARVNLNELIESIAALYREQMVAYDFVVNLPKNAITADIDASYFREAVHNLLQNACDASAPGGRIELNLSRSERSAQIEIRDHGHGMNRDVVSSARIPYFTTKEKGTGLGLAIVEKTVEELHGSLSIESEEGKGTSVSINLPLGE